MGLIPILITIFTNLWPFVRESLFKSASFKRWLATHIFSLVWLAIVTVMFLAGYQLFKAVTEAHILLRDERARNASLVKQIEQFQKESSTLNANEVRALKSTVVAQRSRIVLYEHWMTLCGMNFLHHEQYPENIPKCSNSIKVKPTKPSARRTPRKPTPKKEAPQQSQKHITDQVQDIWSSQ